MQVYEVYKYLFNMKLTWNIKYLLRVKLLKMAIKIGIKAGIVKWETKLTPLVYKPDNARFKLHNDGSLFICFGCQLNSPAPAL